MNRPVFHLDGTLSRLLSDNTVRVQLARPLADGPRLISEVEVRRPTIDDVYDLTELLTTDETTCAFMVLARCCKLTVAQVRSLDTRDFNKLAETVERLG